MAFIATVTKLVAIMLSLAFWCFSNVVVVVK